MRIALPAIMLAAALGASAAAQTLPFEGKWATALETCGKTQDTSPAQPGVPITVTAKRLVAAPFMACDFRSVLPGGMSFRVEAVCEGGGQTGDEFFTFAVLDGRLYWSWAGKTQVFERCPG